MIMNKLSSKSMLLTGCSVSALAMMAASPNLAMAEETEAIPRETANVQAQSGDDDVIELIRVTATKREETVYEVPVAMSAFSGDFTREVNINEVKDVIVWTPGITGNSQDSFIDAVSVRGILTNDFGVGGDPSVGFFKNNLYQGRNGPVNSSFYDMERTEALRGPQNFLFGRNAIGGAISYFTRRPQLDRNSGYIELDVGERDHYVGEGAINISNSDRFGVRVAAYYSHEDGYVDNVATPENDKFLGHEKYAIRGSALYDNGRVNALFTIEYEDRDADGTVYRAVEDSTTFTRLNDLFGVELGGTGRDIDQDLGFDRIEDDSEVLRLGFHLDVDLGSVTLASNTGYTDHDYFYIEDFDGTPLQINDYLQDQTGDYFETDWRLASDTGNKLSWYAGVSYYHENIDAFFSEKADEGTVCAYYFAPYYEPPYYDYDPATAAYYGLLGCQYYYYNNYPYDDPLDGELIEDNRAVGSYKGWAGYVNVNYAFTSRFDVEAGVRYTYDKKNFSLEAFPIDSNLGPFFELGFTTAEPLVDTQSWDAFTPRFTARYRPREDLLLWASVARGYKSGGFGSFAVEALPGEPPLPFLVGTGITNDDARPSDFDPEKVWSYEVGVKGSGADGRLRFDANAYVYKYKDLQLTVAGEGGGIRVDNVGRVTGYGFEGSVQWVMNEYVNVNLSGAHTTTELREAQGICPGPDPEACEGENLSYVPDFSGSARVNFQYPVAGGNIHASAELWGQTDIGGIPISTDPAEKIEAYADLSLRLGYRSNRGWALTGYVENVTNSLYYDGIFPGEGAFPGVRFNPSRPRTFGVRAYAEFGGN